MIDPQKGADSGADNDTQPEEPVFQAEDSPEANAAEGAGEGIEGAGSDDAEAQEPPGNDDLAAELDKARKEMQRAMDESLRARAEMDNVRKRAARDVERARMFALEKFMGDILDVVDSLERGLAAADGDQVTVEQMKEGTELTFKMLEKVLAKHGLEPVEPEGHPFDPELHEAMSLIPTNDCEPNSVVQVVQKGFVLNGRLVRPARVLVAKAVDDGEAAG